MKLIRIQFEVEKDKLEEINELQGTIGERTRTDLFNYALKEACSSSFAVRSDHERRAWRHQGLCAEAVL